MKLLALTIVGLAGTASAANDKVPVTTSSEEARALYTKAQDFADKLRATDAHDAFGKAVAKDPSFAMAYLGMAQTSGTAKDFFDALGHAVALADKVSPGEKLLIASADQGAKNDQSHQKQSLDKLAQMFPNDERIANQLGAYYFGNQDYAKAIASYEKAIKLAPAFTQPYNQLGYAYRFTGKTADAERTFKKYVELIPSDPNPYDSYAELLMEEGKFDDSIASYKKALAIDGNFVASYIGIANDQMFQGKVDDAVKTLEQFTKVARNDGERRTALTWTATAYSWDGKWDQAIATTDKLVAIATANKDNAMLANDDNFIANTLLEAGRVDDAGAKFKAQVEASDKASLPDEVKETTRRNYIYDEARIAAAKKDLKTAHERAALFEKKASNPFEVRQSHELNGMIAIADGKFGLAVNELGKANQRDPRVLYLAAVAKKGAGDAKGSKALAVKAADFNGLAPDYAYVHAKAKALE